MSAFHLHQLQLTRVFQHLVIWDARQEVKQLVVGDGARHDQLPGELVDTPKHDDNPEDGAQYFEHFKIILKCDLNNEHRTPKSTPRKPGTKEASIYSIYFHLQYELNSNSLMIFLQVDLHL